MLVVRRRIRSALAQLIAARRALAALAAVAALGLIAATPAPLAAPPGVAHPLTQAQLKALMPKVPMQTSYAVAVNKLGQVTDAKPARQSANQAFNIQTYGNALQAFIRTADGKAISGTYTLTYDYDPKTGNIRRSVALVRAGGVDPNAKGAALVMMDIARKEAAAMAAAKAKAAKK